MTPPPGTTAAGLGRRLLALGYDLMLLCAVLLGAAALAMVLTMGRLTDVHPYLRLVYFILVSAGFFGWFWTHGGQTLGMRAWGLRLSGPNGAPVQWSQALLRFAAGLLSGGLGLFWVLWDPEGRALHDRWSATWLRRIPS